MEPKCSICVLRVSILETEVDKFCSVANLQLVKSHLRIAIGIAVNNLRDPFFDWDSEMTVESNVTPIHAGIAPAISHTSPTASQRPRGTRSAHYEDREAIILAEMRSTWPFGELPAETIAAMTG